MQDREELAALIRACADGLPRRTLVLALPTALPPPDGAWVPGDFCVQIPLRGRIELALPGDDGWRLIGPRHILAVCAGSWSPRTQRHARRHLAVSFSRVLQVSCYDTPVDGGRRAPEFAARIPEPGAALQACISALLTCAERQGGATVLQGLICAVMPLIAEELALPQVHGLQQALCSYLREHCTEELQRSAVAGRFGIGGDHLTRILKAATGSSFVDLLHRYRLDRACELLRSGDEGVAAIARSCGYGSASYFIRIFRRQHHVTPSVWRRGWHAADGGAA